MNIQMQNYQSKLSIFILAVLASFGAQSATVDVTQFYTGATLTAEMMTSISNAVNDNDFNININTGNISSNTARIEVLEGETARTTVIVNKRRTSDIPPVSFGCQEVSCPATHPIAIGGGVDLDNLYYMQVTSSAPDINGDRPIRTADGTYINASDSWLGCARNESTAITYGFNVVVICSDK